MDLQYSIRRHFDNVTPKFITWEFYERYTKLEPPFGQLGLPVALRTYSRHIEEEKRREKWIEICLRNVEFSIGLDKVTSFEGLKKEAEELFDNMFNMRTFPSGRALWVAGSKQTQVDPSSVWNCTFRIIDSISAYSEIFYWLLIGAGCGFSVEEEYVNQLPSFFNQNKTIKHINEDVWIEGYKDTLLYLHDVNEIVTLTKEHLLLCDSEYLEALNLPYIKPNATILVGDSKEGWANALRTYLTLLTCLEPFQISFDYKYVRPKGIPLKTFGGRASGCRNLIDLFNSINDTITTRKLSSVDCLDIVCIVGRAVVSGGVRRTALICLGGEDDNEFKTAKYDLWTNPAKQKYTTYRTMSNNSIAAKAERPQREQLKESFEVIKSNGEPAFWIVGNAQKYDEEIKGTNPCFAAGTMVMTRDGHYPIEALVGKTVDVYDGNQWVQIDNFRVTGENQEVWEVTLHNGQKIKATPYHSFILETGKRVELRDLKVGSYLKHADITVHGNVHVEGAYLKGFVVGDGTCVENSRADLKLYEPKYMCADRLIDSLNELPVGQSYKNVSVMEAGWRENNSARQKRITITGLTVRDQNKDVLKFASEYKINLPANIHNWDYVSKCEFIAGLFDADGSALDTKNGFAYQITSIQPGMLEDLQLLLHSLNVKSKLSLCKTGGVKDFGEELGGAYNTQPLYRLTISQESSIKLAQQVTFTRLKSFADRTTKYKVKNNSYKVVSIENIGIFDKVYCCTVPTNNSFVLSNGTHIGQCGEAGLRNNQSCNLTTNNVAAFVKHDGDNNHYLDETGWRQSLRLSTRIGTRVTLLPQWHPEWDKTQKSQRLLGVSMTGLMDAVDMLGWNDEQLQDFFVRSRLYVREVADEYSDSLGIERSARISLFKPEGSVSQLPTVSSGIHRAYSPHYIRRVRFSSNDPLATALLDIVGEDNVKPENGQGNIYYTCWKKRYIKLQNFFRKLIKKQPLSLVEKTSLYVEDVNTWVYTFPIETAAKIRAIDESAIDQLERYLLAQTCYTADGHNTSVTVTVAPDEWDEVEQWVYDNWDNIIGVSFLPKFDPEKETYPQMPYEPCQKDKYDELIKVLPTFSENQLISLVSKYEDDYDEYGILEDACSTGACPIR